MIVLFYIILAVLAIVLHTSVAGYFLIWTGAKPDAMLLTTVFLGLQRDRETGLIGGFFLGIFEDILSGGLLGFNALLKGLIGHYTGGLKPNMTARFVVFQCTVVFSASIFYALFAFILAQLFIPTQFMAFTYWMDSIKTVGLNVVLAPFIFSLLGIIEGKMLPSDAGTPYPERS